MSISGSPRRSSPPWPGLAERQPTGPDLRPRPGTEPAGGPPAQGRDRFIDFLRVLSLFVVVAGHWLVVVPYVTAGVAGGRMLYDAVPGFWPLTWVFQVIPLFFFVGGFANHTAYTRLRAEGREREFLGRRLSRLLRPTLVFLGAWLLIEAVMNVLGLGGGGLLRGMRLGFTTPFAQLWFLGVYLVLVALAPVTIRLHERFGARVPAALAVGVAAIDLAAFGLRRPQLLGLNILLVWLLPHQLGYFYADGSLRRLRPRQLLLASAACLLGLAGLTSLPPYGRNLLDDGVVVLGITAPTLPFLAVSAVAVALALWLRAPISSWLRRGTAWRLVSGANSVAMTVYLWHMTAYFLVVAALAAAGLSLPASPDLGWWLERPLFLLLPALPLALLVLVFARFERRPPALSRCSAGRPPRPRW